MSYQTVPFDPEWAKDSCPDVRAIYRRPSRDEYNRPLRGADGTPAWDLTGPLPLRRHADWVAKGFEYITLASDGDLQDGGVLKSLRRRGIDPASCVNGPGRRVWDLKVYLAETHAQSQQDVSDLTALVKQFGSDAVVAIKRQTDPMFELPKGLRNLKPEKAA